MQFCMQFETVICCKNCYSHFYYPYFSKGTV